MTRLTHIRDELPGALEEIERMGKNLPARAQIRPAAFDSKLEYEWSLVLEALKRDKQLHRWDYHPERLRLADGTYYEPDFRLQWADGEVTFDECKGFMREAARVRLNVAAEQHPYRFRLIRKGKRGEPTWKIQETPV